MVLVALVIRLSQNTSRAVEPEAAGFAFLGAGFLCAAGAGSPFGGVLGHSRCTVVGKSQRPDASLRTTASPAVAAICSQTLVARIPWPQWILRGKGPVPITSPSALDS